MALQVPHDNGVKELLKSIKAKDLASAKVKTVDAGVSASDVAALLIESKISAVPVIENGRPVGFVDVLDLSSFLMKCLSAKPKSPSNPEKKKYIFDSRMWKAGTAKSLMNVSHRDPFITVKPDDDLLHVIKLLIGAGSGHRALLLNDKGEIAGVISQGDIIKVFWKNVDKLDLGKLTVKELKFGYCDVARVLTTNTAYDAFERLARRNISGVAVVNIDGHTLFGNLSASDIKHLGPKPDEKWRLVKDTLDVFLSDHSKQEKAIYVLQTETISQVAHKFTDAHVHRLFVADHDERMNLIGVISLSDVLKLLHAAASVKQLASKSAEAKQRRLSTGRKSPRGEVGDRPKTPTAAEGSNSDMVREKKSSSSLNTSTPLVEGDKGNGEKKSSAEPSKSSKK